MADEKKKPMGGLLLALMGKPKKPEAAVSGESSTAEVAAQAVLDAIESKDAKELASAM